MRPPSGRALLLCPKEVITHDLRIPIGRYRLRRQRSVRPHAYRLLRHRNPQRRVGAVHDAPAGRAGQVDIPAGRQHHPRTRARRHDAPCVAGQPDHRLVGVHHYHEVRQAEPPLRSRHKLQAAGTVRQGQGGRAHRQNQRQLV